jgi:hypothetical protein
MTNITAVELLINYLETFIISWKCYLSKYLHIINRECGNFHLRFLNELVVLPPMCPGHEYFIFCMGFYNFMKLYMMCIVSECIYLSMQLNELDLNMAALDPEVSFIQKNMSKYFVEKRVLNIL